MKLPKKTNRYCPFCKKHTEQTLATQKQKSRSSVHPLSRWGNSRTKSRSYKTGHGSLGRFSKPPVKNWKSKVKITKRMTILYKCKECGKMKGISKAIRSSRIEIGEKVSK